MDVVLVPKRPPTVPPICFKDKISDYNAGIIWRRRGAEVVKCAGRDIEFLFGQRLSPFGDDESFGAQIESFLPGTPATIKDFVARFDVLSNIFDWICRSREPRAFLWGHGGSGKSTIAYEIAKIFANNGGAITTVDGHNFDRVIYLSAKEKFIDPQTAKILNFKGTDFSTSRELFSGILDISSWFSDDHELEKLSDNETEVQLENLLEVETQLIIIDDIDTLMHKGIDPGMDALYRCIIKSNNSSKVLYTQRSIPLFATNAAIEVPGLNRGVELEEFIETCCQQFKIPLPSEYDVQKIYDLSEARPLAIETILGLRRVTGSFKNSFLRWKSEAGEEAREYLFRREYDNLSTDSSGRLLLSALALFGSGQQFSTLQSILQFSDDKMQDAITETRDMFLKVEADKDGGPDLYDIGLATRAFVMKVSRTLDMYRPLAARISNFKEGARTTPPEVLTITRRALRHLDDERSQNAWATVNDPDLAPRITEHKEFLSAKGTVAAKMRPQRITDAREAFQAAQNFGYTNYRMYLDWLHMEREAGFGSSNGVEICRYIIDSDAFGNRTKAHFYRLLAIVNFYSARDLENSSPHDSMNFYLSSSTNHFRAYCYAFDSEEMNIIKFESYMCRSFESFSDYCLRHSEAKVFLSFFDDISEGTGPFDALAPVMIKVMNKYISILRGNEINMARGLLNRIFGKRSKDFLTFSVSQNRKSFFDSIEHLREHAKIPISRRK